MVKEGGKGNRVSSLPEDKIGRFLRLALGGGKGAHKLNVKGVMSGGSIIRPEDGSRGEEGKAGERPFNKP